MGRMAKAASALGGAGKGLIGGAKPAAGAGDGGGFAGGLVKKAMAARQVTSPRQGGIRTVASRMMSKRSMSGRR